MGLARFCSLIRVRRGNQTKQLRHFINFSFAYTSQLAPLKKINKKPRNSGVVLFAWVSNGIRTHDP
jgi:hypothetical protein